MTKALLIDATARIVRAVTIGDGDGAALKDMQAYVGGYIEVAQTWGNGDTLYVDEEALLKPQEAFFRIAGRDQPLGGNGLVVGSNDQGENADHVMTIETLTPLVTFVTRFQVDAWAKGNASEPTMTFTSFNMDGTREETVIGRTGSLYGNIPRKPHQEE